MFRGQNVRLRKERGGTLLALCRKRGEVTNFSAREQDLCGGELDNESREKKKDAEYEFPAERVAILVASLWVSWKALEKEKKGGN